MAPRGARCIRDVPSNRACVNSHDDDDDDDDDNNHHHHHHLSLAHTRHHTI